MLQSLKQDFFYLVLVWILQEDLPRRSQDEIRCGKNLPGGSNWEEKGREPEEVGQASDCDATLTVYLGGREEEAGMKSQTAVQG